AWRWDRTHQSGHRLKSVRIPDLDLMVPTCGDNPLPISAERETVKPFAVRRNGIRGLARCDVPLDKIPSEAAGVQCLSVLREDGGGDHRFPPGKIPNWLTRLCIPQAQQGVPAAGHE